MDGPLPIVGAQTGPVLVLMLLLILLPVTFAYVVDRWIRYRQPYSDTPLWQPVVAVIACVVNIALCVVFDALARG